MMLAELNNLYKRLIDAGEPLATKGRSLQKISFCIVINEKGELVGIDSMLQEKLTPKKGNLSYSSKMVANSRIVLGGTKSSGEGFNPCFLWDNAAYLLGYVAPTSLEKDKARAKRAFEESRRKYLEVEHIINCLDYSAVCRFFESWNPDNSLSFFAKLDVDINCFVNYGIFRINRDIATFVHESREIQSCWDASLSVSWNGDEDTKLLAQCLVTGDIKEVARLHSPGIENVNPKKTVKLVSFNKNSFDSYAKLQCYNAPVSADAAFGYCNALNYLLNRKSNHLKLGNMILVFWTDSSKSHLSDYLAGWASSCLNPNNEAVFEEIEAMDESLVPRIKDSLRKMVLGLPVIDMFEDSSTRFFILGLTPNNTRASVRFYNESSLTDFLGNVQRHYLDMRLQPRGGPYNDPEIISPFMILRQTERKTERKDYDMPPMYGSALLRSILLGRPYPDVIAQAIIRRIKTDFDINYKRVAFLKAWLIRRPSGNTNNNTISIMLDKTNTNIGYVLGRLFATLLKTQKDAARHRLNRTIRESCYSGASSSPRSVFPLIIKTYAHHLKKIENRGRVIAREKLMVEIYALFDHFPPHLNLEQQGLFSIGFYHQTQDFYSPKEDKIEKPQL